jgi:hypothetical protein
MSMPAPLEQTWRHLIDHSDHDYEPVQRPKLLPPLLIKSAVPDGFCSNDDLVDIFGGLQDDRALLDTALLRIYIDGMLSPRHEERLLDARMRPNESFRSWLERALREPTFGVVVNGAERWTDSLSRKVISIFGPLIDHWGIPATSVELTLFIGNYGYTPFGVHVDDPYTHVFHFHLGPGAKRMTLLAPDVFLKLSGSRKRCFDFDRLLVQGEPYDIEAGDVYLLPPHYYHVGFTDGFSIGVAVAIGRYPASALHARATRQAIAGEQFERLVGSVLGGASAGENPSQAADLSFAAWLEAIYEEFIASELSRRSLKYAPARREPTIGIDRIVQADPDFPIEIIARGERLVLYVRGHRLELARHADLVRLLDLLAVPQPIRVRELCTRFDATLEADAILRLLGELEACGGLLVSSDAPAPVRA